MDTKLLNLQSKGQIMIPKAWRDEIGATAFKAVKKGDVVVLYPVRVASDEEVKSIAEKIMKEDEALLRSLASK